MLAPLKDRSLIEREPSISADQRIAQLEAANAALGSALRQARQAQKRSATLTARKIVAQANEISRLEASQQASRQRLAALESGQAIIELGQRLLAISAANERLSAANEQLSSAARRVWTLDKCLCAAHQECVRLAWERDQAIGRLDRAHSDRALPAD